MWLLFLEVDIKLTLIQRHNTTILNEVKKKTYQLKNWQTSLTVQWPFVWLPNSWTECPWQNTKKEVTVFQRKHNCTPEVCQREPWQSAVLMGKCFVDWWNKSWIVQEDSSALCEEGYRLPTLKNHCNSEVWWRKHHDVDLLCCLMPLWRRKLILMFTKISYRIEHTGCRRGLKNDLNRDVHRRIKSVCWRSFLLKEVQPVIT